MNKMRIKRVFKYRLRGKSAFNCYLNYALFATVAILVLVAAHAKSTQPNEHNPANHNKAFYKLNVNNTINTLSSTINKNQQSVQNSPAIIQREFQHQQQQQQQHQHHRHKHHQHQHEHLEHSHHEAEPRNANIDHEYVHKRKQHSNNHRHSSKYLFAPTSGIDSHTDIITNTNSERRPYRSKFTIEELLNTKFPHRVSNDIDMDPCKASGFMGDIALPDIDYNVAPIVAHTDASAWMEQADEPVPVAADIEKPTKFNITFQQELEKLKQEVYHEGLQVEEEGLTHIIRKKTKLPSTNNVDSAEKRINDAVMSANEPVKPTANSDEFVRNFKNEIIGANTNNVGGYRSKSNFYTSETTEAKSKDLIVEEVAKSENNEHHLPLSSLHNVEAEIEKSTKHSVGLLNRFVDQRKIQSNTKDIEDDSGNNFVSERKLVILPTSPPIIRSTLPNVFSNAGGNGMKLDDVDVLRSEGALHRRHRRGRKNRRSSDYNIRLQHLKDELNRPVHTAQDYHHLQANNHHNGISRHAQQQQQHQHSEHKHHHHHQHHQHHHHHDEHHQQHHLHKNNGTLYKLTFDEDRTPQNVFNAFNYSAEIVDEMDILTKRKATMDAITSEVHTSLEQEIHNPENIQNLKHHHRIARAVTAKKERVWDYGVIPYEIDRNFSGMHKALFKQAMRHWENSTCIKFVERDPEIHPNYMVFTIRSCGCCSFVGKRGNGPQAISIGRNCDKFGIVVHELGHVVGFWHEHTRPDREKHVVIEHNNIMKGQDYNFNKLTPDEVDSLGMAYDYDSIMHYARNTFSKGTYLDTILPIEVKGKKRPEIGQRLRLSAGDIAQANILYKCPKCGRTFQENTGIFYSPSYYTAGAINNDSELCEWRITATHGERIVLRLENLNILKSNNCQTDYLEVRDGYYFKSPLIGRFCGKVSDEILTTETSRMLLTYVNTHRAEGYRGFKAEYDVVCGGELTIDESDGRLESPNYPLEYLPNKECVWKITVPNGYQVALKFQSFEVENHDSCVYDYVEVRDGPKDDSPLIGVFCGYKPPPNMKSTGNTMFVKFVSDTSVQKAGFSATFMREVDECETLNHGCEHECINTLGGYECSCHIGYELHSDKKHCEDACGGVIEYPNGTITSPSFPHMYPLRKECIWEIIASPKHRISLNFTHFDLEGTAHQQAECGYDYVKIYTKLSENRLKHIGTYCGNALPPVATSESNALRVEFHSDKSVQRSGFAAVFFTDVDECANNNGGCQHDCRNTIGSYMCSCHNGYSLHENAHDCKEGECKYEISTPYGTIYSPNYPDSYPPNADCVWHFSTTPGHRIKLIFNEFYVESHQECAYDNVAIYDGDSENSSILGRFCGDKIPYPIASSSNQLYMVLKTDKNKQMNGFTAMHSTSCGGYLRATSQIQQFYSHARYGNSDYNENMDCEWTIQAPTNLLVQLVFLTIDIESSENCTFDYVQVFSGMEDTSGPMFGQYCGNTLPQDIISLTDSLLVRFKTDISLNAKGFSISYVAIDPFENSEDEEPNSYSSEMVTPFPGSLKSIYKEDTDNEDFSDLSENQLFRYYKPRNPYPNRL